MVLLEERIGVGAGSQNANDERWGGVRGEDVEVPPAGKCLEVWWCTPAGLVNAEVWLRADENSHPANAGMEFMRGGCWCVDSLEVFEVTIDVVER
jgi:hypothetical protein